MSEELTLIEMFRLFHRQPDDVRWIGSADSTEYLNVVSYLVNRNNKEA